MCACVAHACNYHGGVTIYCLGACVSKQLQNGYYASTKWLLLNPEYHSKNLPVDANFLTFTFAGMKGKKVKQIAFPNW